MSSPHLHHKACWKRKIQAAASVSNPGPPVSLYSNWQLLPDWVEVSEQKGAWVGIQLARLVCDRYQVTTVLVSFCEVGEDTKKLDDIEECLY